MPAPTANNTGNVLASGQWQLMAGSGDITVSCHTGFEWIIATALPSESTIGHKVTHEDFSLTGDLRLYVRAATGTTVVLTAETPLVS